MMLVMVAYDLITSWVIEQRHVFNIRLPVYPSVQLTVLLIYQTIAADYGVRSLPTFVFVRGNKVIDRLLGAQVELLKNKLREHAKQEGADSTSQSSGQGSKQPDLSPYLEITQCECLNEDDAHPISNVLRAEPSDSYLLSDTDAQLVIFITFSQFVKLRSIQLNGPEDCGPKTVKLFLNQTSTPDFSACESAEAVQTFKLEPKDLTDGAVLALNYVKFQKVTTLTIFVADNQEGTDVTRINKLRFFGSPVNTTNMQNFKRVAGKTGEGHS
ncbi:uncharacterized protein DEA37_0006417 [Paragonimus westermani]|uniref:PITH domain-containing protein n=1 Tax=Paragonimus westermani TaxID=34504 RepID=A0A5J4NAP9_9TREM|nr:uncharacterized protein DEA37_0006417 [Paragonimus westermani]